MELMQAVLTTPGATSVEVRRAVSERVTSRVLQRPDAPAGTASVPDNALLSAEMMAYVDSVAERSDDVTTVQVDALRDAGLSEDAIFELTVVAAVARGTAQLQRGIDALEAGG